MAAFMDESGVIARIGYSPIREILQSHFRAFVFHHAPIQNLRFSTYQIPTPLTGQCRPANHFNANLAKTFINSFTGRGGGAAMR